MPTQPNFQLGRSMTSLVVTPVTIAADGTITDTTPVATLTAVLENFDYESTNELEEISAVTQRRQNHVITSTGTTATIDIIMKGGTDTAYAINTLGAIAYNQDYTRVTLVQSNLTWGPFYNVIAKFSSGIKGKGKVTAHIELSQIDPGAANPAIS